MALRFCKGKYIINDVNNINYDFFNINDDGIIVLKDRGKISAYMDSSLKEYRTFVHKENVFETGLSLIKKTGLEYIPVIHNDEIVCFCYNDELLDDIVKKVKDLIIFAPKNLFSDYSNGIIYGYNELAFYLEMLFKKNNFPYKVVAGSLSKNDTLKENNKTINLYVEGHLGLAINNYSYWKVFHEWLYLSIRGGSRRW